MQKLVAQPISAGLSSVVLSGETLQQPSLIPVSRWMLQDAAYITHFQSLPHQNFVLGYHDGTIKIISDGKFKQLPATHSRILSLLVLKNGNFMTAHADGMLYVWDAVQGDLINYTVIGRIVSLLELSDETLAMGLQDGHILRYDPIKQKVFDYIGTSSSRNNDLLQLLSTGQLLSGRRDVGMLCFWNLDTKRRIKLFRTHIDLYALALINASQLATSHRNGKVYIWDLKTENCIIEFTNHFHLIHSLVALPHNRIAIGDANGDIKIWDNHKEDFIAEMSLTKKSLSELVYPTYVNHLTAVTQDTIAYVTNYEVGVLALGS